MLPVEGHEQVREVDPADEQPDERHQHVVDQRRDDLPERRTYDHADGKVERVALDRELLELLPHGPTSLGRYVRSVTATRAPIADRHPHFSRGSARPALSSRTRPR